jgi:hypothetical protein
MKTLTNFEMRDVETLLHRSERTKDEKLIKAVREIAAQRFQFPSEEFPAYRTYVNVPEVTMGVQSGSEEVVPHIVVVERTKQGDTSLVMTAQVCGREDVTASEAEGAWARFARVPKQAFYLYVPVGFGKQAKQICKQHKIRVTAFRTWRETPRGFEINDITEPPSPLAPLMPPFVRRFLATP